MSGFRLDPVAEALVTVRGWATTHPIAGASGAETTGTMLLGWRTRQKERAEQL